jgi:hypothetical protein
VEQGQLARFAIRAEEGEEKILERIHENVSPEGGGARVSMWRPLVINPGLASDTFSQ